MENGRVVLTTFPSVEVGQKIAHTLVEERLCACLNLLPQVTSVYRWQGKIEQESEVLGICKTTADKLQACITRLVELHPYEVPEAIALPIDAGHPAYLKWLAQETS